jgi:D-xylonolactonase
MADPMGRVFCGTMPTPGGKKGALYRLDTDRSLTPLLQGIGCSNGMGFTLDGRQMYYTDTGTRSIYLFDYDLTTGAITNQRTHILVPQSADGGAPDGMTVDTAGHLWSARWGGSRITHYDEAGTELDHIDLPAPCITSLIYGGPDLRDVYVTSAVGGAKDPVDAAGALFHYRAAVPGRPEYLSRIHEN